MKLPEIHNRFREYSNLQTCLGLSAPDLIEIAFFIEDNFNIILDDSEISPENMGNLKTAEQFVIQKLRGNSTCAESAES